MLRVAFAGTPEFAVPTLHALAASGHRLIGVVTQPDRPAGRGRGLSASPIKRLAQELALPLSQPAELRSEAGRAALVDWAPEVLVVVAYGQILPPAVLALPRLGCINLHASLLPRWRGAAPIPRAILAGDSASGVTVMQIVEQLDAGPILAQRRVAIGADEDAQQLQRRLSELGAPLLMAVLDDAEHGRLHPLAQPESGVSYAAKLAKSEAAIDWRRGAIDIHRQVRAFNPAPVARTGFHGQPLLLWHSRLPEVDEADEAAAAPHGRAPALPGAILGLQGELLLVQCGRGRLGITRLQLAGRRSVSAREFVSGHAIEGQRFG